MNVVLAIELCATALVAMYLTVVLRHAADPWLVARRLGLLVAASWLSEDSCIHAYGFYAYDSRWHLFVDQVPLMVVLIWPVVIHSAGRIASQLLGPSHRLVPLAGAAIVLADASLIEPISVSAGLWWWTEPGLFHVPPIGVLGWALHAGLCLMVLRPQRRRPRGAPSDAAVLLLAPLGTHAALLGCWWAALRWVSVPIPPWPMAALGWTLSLGLTAGALRSRARERVAPRTMWMRLPAAGLFFALLATRPERPAGLLAYALAFAPPYLALMRLRVPRRSRSPASG